MKSARLNWIIPPAPTPGLANGQIQDRSPDLIQDPPALYFHSHEEMHSDSNTCSYDAWANPSPRKLSATLSQDYRYKYHNPYTGKGRSRRYNPSLDQEPIWLPWQSLQDLKSRFPKASNG